MLCKREKLQGEEREKLVFCIRGKPSTPHVKRKSPILEKGGVFES